MAGPIREGIVGAVLADNAVRLARAGIFHKAVEASVSYIEDIERRRVRASEYEEGWCAVQLDRNGCVEVALLRGETSGCDPITIEFTDLATGQSIEESYNPGTFYGEWSMTVAIENDGKLVEAFTENDKILCEYLGNKILAVLPESLAAIRPNTLGV